MDLYILVFIVEVLMDEAKVYNYIPTNSPPMTLTECNRIVDASADDLHCIPLDFYQNQIPFLPELIIVP